MFPRVAISKSKKTLVKSVVEATSVASAASPTYGNSRSVRAFFSLIARAAIPNTLRVNEDSEVPLASIDIAKAIAELLASTISLQEFANNDAFWIAIDRDRKRLKLFSDEHIAPLWHNSAPDWFTTADLETRAIWAKDPAAWAFWEKWWDGVISGDMPFVPELLRDVALIEEDIWQAGPKAVAQAIARIEKIHDLRAQLAALTQAMEDEDLSQVQRGATLAHRGHNNPPEIIEAYEIVQASALEIAQALDDAREELAKPAPKPSRLKAIGTWMRSAIMNAAGYCGGLTDTFLQGYAETLGEEAAKWTMRLISGGVLLSMLKAFAVSLGVWP